MKLAVAAVVIYTMLPGHPLGLATGLPLPPAVLVGLLLFGSLLFGLWPTRPVGAWPRRIAFGVGVACVVKLGLWAPSPSYGLPGWYFANARSQPPHERSTEFVGEPWTRRDVVIDFGGDEFPAYFLNDVLRFNFLDLERRRNIAFSVRWQGSLFVERAGNYTFWLTASGPAGLRIDGQGGGSVDAEGRATSQTRLELARGSHQVLLTYARRPPRSPDLKVEWDGNGEREHLATPFLLAAPIEPAAWERDRWLGRVASTLDALVGLVALGVIGGLAVRRSSSLERQLLGALLAVAVLHAAIPDWDRIDKVTLLGGGQDWLTHETFARDIVINGPLMTLGKPLGEGRTFYAQPFYPYALAAMHWLTGEDLFGVVVLQLFGLGVAGVLLFYVAKRLFGTWAAVATLVLFLILRHMHLDWVARRLLSEPVYFVTLPAMLLALVAYVDERRPRDIALAGVFLGLCIVTRGPTLLYVPIAVGVLAWRLRRDAIRPIAALVLIAGSIMALVPIRNAIVAGEPALVASSGGVNLEKHHRPTPRVRLNEANRRWYADYVQDQPTREVLEFIQQDPIGYLEACAILAAYSLGYAAAIDESTITWWPQLVALNLLWLAAVWLMPMARSARAVLLHGFIAVHLATMVIFTPYDYDNRLVLPMYLPITVFAGAVLARWVSQSWRTQRA